jgi:hypothetical protein
MKLIPILYSTPMVQAKQAGMKTQTRRIISEAIGWDPIWRVMPAEDAPGRFSMRVGSQYTLPYFKPRFGKPGDILWTREAYANLNVDFKKVPPYYVYKADLEHENQHGPLTWKPAIHMPFAACRSLDVITAIRAERIMDISAEDAIAEGIDPLLMSRMQLAMDGQLYRNYLAKPELFNEGLKPIDSYRSLWQHLNGTPKPIQKKVNGKLVTNSYIAYPWGDRLSLQPYEGLTTWRGKPLTVVANPWVWVVEFRPVRFGEKPFENWFDEYKSQNPSDNYSLKGIYDGYGIDRPKPNHHS